MSGLLVSRSGILTLIEDSGRFGYGDIGISQSGVADRYSATWANRLLFNHYNVPVLEILLGGVSLVSKVNTVIALTGAECSFAINGDKKELWRSHRVHKGDTVEIGMAKSGLRAYLAVSSGFHTEEILCSYSTTLKEAIGEKIENGDLLSCSENNSFIPTATPKNMIPDFLDTITLRVVAGYQHDEFDNDAKELFFDSPYEVTNATDRMGCRLLGEAIDFEGEIISEPISYGTVQIPSDGQPIVLLNERQTIGGYPKIGSVIPMDCYRLTQAQPGTTIAFKKIELDEAVKKTIDINAFLIWYKM